MNSSRFLARWRACRGGGCEAEELGHRGAHSAAHGGDDANFAGEGEG